MDTINPRFLTEHAAKILGRVQPEFEMLPRNHVTFAAAHKAREVWRYGVNREGSLWKSPASVRSIQGEVNRNKKICRLGDGSYALQVHGGLWFEFSA